VKLTDLRGILQYIPQFREKTFILSVDGAIVTSENFANILLDVAVLRSLNIRVVLVHGAWADGSGWSLSYNADGMPTSVGLIGLPHTVQYDAVNQITQAW